MLPLSTAFELSSTFSCREQHRLRVATSTKCRQSNGLKSHLEGTCTISNTSHTTVSNDLGLHSGGVKYEHGLTGEQAARGDCCLEAVTDAACGITQYNTVPHG